MRAYTITQNDAHQRLDKFLKKLFPEASLSFLYKLNRTNKIKIVPPLTILPKSPPLTILPLSRGDEAADTSEKLR